jgi:hypothetical protein
MAGWRRAAQPGAICVVIDVGPCRLPSALTDRTACLGLELLSCEPVANPAVVADILY